jgi:hypothetical protein
MAQFSCLSSMQGNAEQRTEAYQVYGEGAAQALTPQTTKSHGRVSSSAAKQAGATGGLR